MKAHPKLALILKLAASIWMVILAVCFFRDGDLSMGLLTAAAGITGLVLVGRDFTTRRGP